MSESIYLFLLRLYPRHFREAYSEEVLELFRDRSRHERGFLKQTRLWMDLLYDLAASIPREYQRRPASPRCAFAKNGEPSTPTFYNSDNKGPRVGALFAAGAVSALTFALIPVSIGSHGPSALLPSGLLRSVVRPVMALSGANLDEAECRRVVDFVIQNVRQHYFDREVAHKLANALLMHEKRGDYAVVPDGNALAILLTEQMRTSSHDMHLDVVYSKDVIPIHPPERTPEMLAHYRSELERANCTIQQVSVLAHNIGYLKLDGFPDVSICKGSISAAMASLNNVNAIIFDLRDNRGGDGNMVSLIASYLFNHPEFLYDPRTNPTAQSWTRPQAGSKLTDKPAYVLTSGITISAAEQFTYNLKMLKRVTLVGQTTHGSAHAGVFYRLDDHFGMGIPKLKPINPYSSADWEGTGVAPDVQVKAADALELARKLAQQRVEAK